MDILPPLRRDVILLPQRSFATPTSPTQGSYPYTNHCDSFGTRTRRQTLLIRIDTGASDKGKSLVAMKEQAAERRRMLQRAAQEAGGSTLFYELKYLGNFRD